MSGAFFPHGLDGNGKWVVHFQTGDFKIFSKTLINQRFFPHGLDGTLLFSPFQGSCPPIFATQVG